MDYFASSKSGDISRNAKSNFRFLLSPRINGSNWLKKNNGEYFYMNQGTLAVVQNGLVFPNLCLLRLIKHI
jgi:hypothetical protein